MTGVSQVSPPRAAPPATRPDVYRLTLPTVVWWVWLAFAVVNIADVAIEAPARFAVVVSAVIVAITGFVYACALRPRVIAGEAGLRVLNPVRDHRVPWGSVLAVDVGDWVRVRCAPGPGEATGKTIDSWALFVPARTRLKARRRGLDPAALSRASRLPDEAKSVVSLSPAQAIARQLDERAARERARGAAAGPPVASWAWPSLAAMVAPLVALLIVVVLT
jgi:hypothetical protein